MPTRCKRWFLLQILLLAQHVSGTIMPITRSFRVLYRWLLPVVFGALKTKAPNTTGSNHLYNTLELLVMGIMVPETCWASNKFCNKNHLLHLVGILFPHIDDDARSKSLQIYKQPYLKLPEDGVSVSKHLRVLKTNVKYVILLIAFVGACD